MSRRVLIAEDEPNIVTSLEFLLRQCACEVRVARDGEEALRLAAEFRPDLLLLDVMMPRKNGLEVCRGIRENPELERMRIVMLSARGREAEIRAGISLGADAYITKPFSTKELLAQVRGLLPQES
jgi:DNA-binding response OmpR family regulator